MRFHGSQHMHAVWNGAKKSDFVHSSLDVDGQNSE